MITFCVVKEQYGWAIRMDKRMMTPFWSRDMAIREANCLARAIRCHGECAEVIVEGAVPSEPLADTADTSTLFPRFVSQPQHLPDTNVGKRP